ncbi:MAG: YqaJ viral recombinase family protein [Candidatus Nanopelagicales bacterium]
MSTAAAEVMDFPNVPKADWSCPNATQVLRYDAPKTQWLEERTKGIGGSDAAKIMGFDPWAGPYDVWLSKMGRGEEKETNLAMRLGQLMEEPLITLFEENTGLTVQRKGLMQSKTHPFMRVSVDGLVSDGGIFEAKTTRMQMRDEWADGQVTDRAEIQVQHGLAVTGRSHAWVVVMIGGELQEFRRVERDEELIKTIIEMEERFWTEHVLAGKAPEPIAADLETVKQRHGLAVRETIAAGSAEQHLIEQLFAQKQVVKEAEKVEADLEAKVREAFGSADEMSVHGVEIASNVQNGTFSAKKFAAQYPELAKELVVMKPALDMDTIKDKHPKKYTACRARVIRQIKPKK